MRQPVSREVTKYIIILHGRHAIEVCVATIYYFTQTVLINLENLPTSSLETHSGSSDGAVSFPSKPAASVREGSRSL